MELWQLALLVATGLVAGFLNVTAGGGSLLTVPVMVFMGVPGPVANGSNRIAILAQSITAVGAFFRRGFADFRLSLTLACCAVPGALLGASFGVRLEGIWFERVLALVMIAVLLLMIFGDQRERPDKGGEPSRRQLLLGHICMVGVGIYGGFIQVGVGFIIMPVLHRVMGLDLLRTNMHKVFIVMSYSAAALLVFAARVEILWAAGLALALGNSAGGWVSANLQLSRGDSLIRVVLNVVLVAFIIKLLFFH